jgi:hypothetical protein
LVGSCLVGCGSFEPYSSCAALSRAEVDTLISYARSDRAAGFSYSQELGGVLQACQGFDFDCQVCGTAVVDYVWGF